MESVKAMTQYFRDSVAAKTRVGMKNKDFKVVELETIKNGLFDESIVSSFVKEKEDKANIIIVAKTIKPEFSEQEQISNAVNEMMGIFYIPAILNKEGQLSLPKDKYPWIPREHLSPIIEDTLAIGKVKDADEFFSENINRFKDEMTWNEYYEISKEMYTYVTKVSLEEKVVNNIELESNVYIIKDDSINATRNILKLYDHLLSKDSDPSLLYKRFMKTETTLTKPLVPNTEVAMKKHVGQMNNEFPLSPSQRESVNHFAVMEEGETLAVNGPPGTGKTALLQSLVANLYVEKALKKENAPLIVASSANNQAVTNIIDSFKTSNEGDDSDLDKRWITGVDSFAVYFPSMSKENEAKKYGYQYMNSFSKKFFLEIESEKNIQSSTEKILKNCNDYFHTTVTEIKSCEELLHKRLKKVSGIQDDLLSVLADYEKLGSNGKNFDQFLESFKKEQKELENMHERLRSRVQEWEEHFKSIPIIYRLLSFISFFSSKIKIYNRYFINPEEIFLDDTMLYEDILEEYSQQITDLNEEIRDKQNMINKVEKLKVKYDKIIMDMKVYELILKEDIESLSINDINEKLDTNLRYKAFWLAVHYFEIRWLQAKRLSKAQEKTTFGNVLKQMYSNLSMVAPCFVMTFFQLSSLLKAYNSGDPETYLYNYIDLLIVDEAGQVSPEIAACSFALAKKAVVVGDFHQISPVWNMSESLDYSLAKAAGVKKSEEELTDLGLNASRSSVMHVASQSCFYEKYNNRGLFLSEHRRCYNEIIDYSNQLVYQGKLEPKRGKGKEDDNYPLTDIQIPHFAIKQIDTIASQTIAGSRYNKKEAVEIAQWLTDNFNDIKTAYMDQGADPKEIIGIITPFKVQANTIQSALSSEIKKYVKVGTVHTFQGGERNLIIMSTVYGKNDGCYFIDREDSLLNVAVSRAKDSFLIFGDINCLSNDSSKPSGLLREKIAQASI